MEFVAFYRCIGSSTAVLYIKHNEPDTFLLRVHNLLKILLLTTKTEFQSISAARKPEIFLSAASLQTSFRLRWCDSRCVHHPSSLVVYFCLNRDVKFPLLLIGTRVDNNLDLLQRHLTWEYILVLILPN